MGSTLYPFAKSFIMTRPFPLTLNVVIGEKHMQSTRTSEGVKDGTLKCKDTDDSTLEEEGALKNDGANDGNDEGGYEGTNDVTLKEEGALNGTNNINDNGKLDGSNDGTLEGAKEGNKEGPDEGALEGNTDGSLEGANDGANDGNNKRGGEILKARTCPPSLPRVPTASVVPSPLSDTEYPEPSPLPSPLISAPS